MERRFHSLVNESESTWEIEDGRIRVELWKVFPGEVWKSLFEDSERISESTEQELRKTILLERFSSENPGMDFSSAEFSGGCIPDPRSFMGGISPG
jgi:hypothetical protein